MEEENDTKSMFYYGRWFLGVLCLAVLGLSSGTINLFPSLVSKFEDEMHMPDSLAIFMLTGGTVLMYFTLPAGLYMDYCGSYKLLVLSVIVTATSGLSITQTADLKYAFCIFYLLFALGNSSIFIAVLEIVLSHAPIKIKGVSTSIVSASLSFAFGFWFLFFNIGKSRLITGIRYVVYFSVGFEVIFVALALILVKPYKPPPLPVVEKKSHTDVLKNWMLYALLFGMMITVFEGLFVLSGGSYVWNNYDPSYTDATSIWSMPFSATNCIFTILLSLLLDFICGKFAISRKKGYSIFLMILSIIPLYLSLMLVVKEGVIPVGIGMSAMGICFGFGLTQIPALTSDTFGNEKYGFAFGIIQIGSIISSMTAMPIIQLLKTNGLVILLVILAIMQLSLALLLFFTSKYGNDIKE